MSNPIVAALASLARPIVEEAQRQIINKRRIQAQRLGLGWCDSMQLIQFGELPESLPAAHGEVLRSDAQAV